MIPSQDVRFIMNQRSYEFPTFVALCQTLGVRSYVEVGTGGGGSTSYVWNTLRIPCVGIDVQPDRPKYLPGGAHYLMADSRLVPTRERAIELLGAFPDAVFIDTDHTLETTKKEFEIWWPITQIVMGFHDICLTGTGVPEFWKEVRTKYRSLEIIARDDFSNTENPNDQHGNWEWAGIGALLKC